MSNLATPLTAIPCKLYGSTKVTPVACTFDTTASDLTVYAAVTGKALAIVGMQYAEASAHNLTLTFGTTVWPAFEMAANSGRDDKLGQGVLAAGGIGEALKIQVSVAVTGMVVFVIETDRLYF